MYIPAAVLPSVDEPLDVTLYIKLFVISVTVVASELKYIPKLPIALEMS